MSNPELIIVKADPTTLPVDSQPIQLCPSLGPGQSVVVYNNDLTNVGYVGYRTAGLSISNTVPIQPLSSATLDASRVMYAFCPTATIQLTVAPNGSNIQPSPAQIAAQISLIGLATSANQASQLAVASATETAVNTTNTTLGSPAQNTTVVNPNPSLLNGSNVGYTAFNAAQAVTNTPLAGCPGPYALVITPNGASTQPNFTGGAFPATPGQFYMCRPAVCLPFIDANVINIQTGFDWYSDQAGTVKIGTSVATLAVPPANQWVWLNSGSPGFQAPAGTVTSKFKIILNGTANVAAADVWQAAAMYAFTLLPGVPAQDSTLSHLHDRVANTGVPLLVLSQSLTAAALNVVSPGTQNLGPFTFKQVSYEIVVALANSAANQIPVNVTLTWSDSALGGAVTAVEQWQMFPGDNPTTSTVQGHGPTKGDTLNISVNAVSGVGTVTGTLSIAQHSRVYIRDDWRHSVLNAMGGIGTANPNGPMGILAQGSPLMPTNTSREFLLPLYSGQVQVNFASTSLVSDAEILINAIGLTAGFSTPFQEVNAANKLGTALFQCYLPRAQCALVLFNANAGNQNLEFFLTIAEQTTS